MPAMAITLTRRAARGLLYLTALFGLLLLVLAVVLPYDHSWRLRARFEWHEATSHFTTPLTEQTWFFKRPKNALHFDSAVGLIIKTSYGRGEHVVAQLLAMGLTGTEDGVIVVGDSAQELEVNGHEVQVHNVIGPMLEEKHISDMGQTRRAARYHELQDAIASGQDGEAKKLSNAYSEDLDTMKYVPGFELAHNLTSTRKWWIMIDDDTLLLRASLERLLARLDPSKDQYLGFALTSGRYERFAQGGGAITLSQSALTHLFSRPDIVLGAKLDSVRDPPGDVLIAVALIKLGIFIDDRFTPFFNDLQPKYTRVTAENFCLPIVDFHGFGAVENVITAGSLIMQHGERKMLFNGAIWTILREVDISAFAEHPVRPGHDYVGPLGRAEESGAGHASKTYADVGSAMDCVSKCDRDWDVCLAWTWIEETNECRLASWVIVGDDVEGRSSGLHFPRAKEIGDRCVEVMKKAGCFEPGAECGI